MSDASLLDKRAFAFLKNAESLLVMVILAIILWVGKTTYDNSIILTRLSTQMASLSDQRDNELSQLQAGQDRIDHHLSTIWPRLREMKERIQHLESEQPSTDHRSRTPWKY